MNAKRTLLIAISVLVLLPAIASANSGGRYNIVGAGGYDLASYHQDNGPLRGNGNHLVEHDGVAYLFSNETNKEAFEANPSGFLPQYGGYCAFGVAKGKKFVGDPEVWSIVNDKLYLNLDSDVQKLWRADTAGHIEDANEKWSSVQDKHPSEL